MSNSSTTVQPISNNIRIVDQGVYTLSDISLLVALASSVLTIFFAVKQNRINKDQPNVIKLGDHTSPCTQLSTLDKQTKEELIKLREHNQLLRGKVHELDLRVRQLELCATKMGCEIEVSVSR